MRQHTDLLAAQALKRCAQVILSDILSGLLK